MVLLFFANEKVEIKRLLLFTLFIKMLFTFVRTDFNLRENKQ